MGWLKKLFVKNNNDKSIVSFADEFNKKMANIRQAGSSNGKHYTDSVEQIKQLKREGKYEEAIAILLQSINLTELYTHTRNS